MIHSILLSAAMAHRSISLILSTFEGVLVPRKHRSMLRIKAKVSFYPCTDHIFRFFSSVSKTFSSMRNETATFPAHSIKTWKHNDVKNPCSTWRTHWLYPRFFSFSFFLWTAGRLRCKWHLGNGLKILTLQKVVCSIIHNPLAETSALVWLLVFEDFGSSSPVNGVSNGSITTFLQASPSISAVRFLSSLCLVVASPPFGQGKVCCKLNESPQTHSVGKRSRGILYVIRIASQKACLSRKKPFLFIDITVNQIDAPFSVLIFLYHFHNNILLFLVSRLCFSDNKSNHSFLYIVKKITKHLFS